MNRLVLVFRQTRFRLDHMQQPQSVITKIIYYLCEDYLSKLTSCTQSQIITVSGPRKRLEPVIVHSCNKEIIIADKGSNSRHTHRTASRWAQASDLYNCTELLQMLIISFPLFVFNHC